MSKPMTLAQQLVREMTVDRLGHRGDGMAEDVFIPNTVPGDRVRVAIYGDRGRVLERLEDGPHRRAPACRHFAECGGCAVQHVEDSLYRSWKLEQLTRALAHRGFADVAVEPLISIPPGTRRRVSLRARIGGTERIMGFQERASHRLVDVEECPITRPEIVAALPSLRSLVAAGLANGGTAQVQVTHTESGLDVVVSPEPERPLEGWQLEPLANEAIAMGLARLTWNGDLVVERAPPYVIMSGTGVAIPPGAFLQPSAEGEAALARLVAEAVGGIGKTADLFAGCGTFTFALARSVPVHAVEGDGAQLAVIDATARTEREFKPITMERRDLTRRPLIASELKPFKAVVLDPPRAGARTQVAEIAKSSVERVVLVSCNPATFARDLRMLVDAGYTLGRITPVDQFVWSPELEVVGVLTRG
ncbi:MAG: class I SAM-dependent RNA methyltransferase [Alphaproteobacteria bacterium]|nr:class I SAM-dependent RNA methyltransferase [Alphaproteobacteria bacterium]